MHTSRISASMVGPKYQADIPEYVGPGPGGGDDVSKFSHEEEGNKVAGVHSNASAEAIFSPGRIEHQFLEVSVK